MEAQPPVYIIGAGVSGLIAAFELEQAGHFEEVLAGDHLLNGSLNAAMESGRLAAKALLLETTVQA